MNTKSDIVCKRQYWLTRYSNGVWQSLCEKWWSISKNSKASPGKVQGHWVTHSSVDRTLHPTESSKERRGFSLGPGSPAGAARVKKYSTPAYQFPILSHCMADELSLPFQRDYSINSWSHVRRPHFELEWNSE